MKHCGTCGAAIKFAYSINGARVPVDHSKVQADEWTQGLCFMNDYNRIEFVKKKEFEPGVYDISHYATCPDREAWSKKK